MCLPPGNTSCSLPDAGWWSYCWGSPLCRQLSVQPSCEGSSLCALSDPCGAGAGLGGPAGPEGETAETPGTGSGREGLLPLAEQGCGESRPYLLPPCLFAVGPGRLRRGGSPFAISLFSPNGGFQSYDWTGLDGRRGRLFQRGHKERNSESRGTGQQKGRTGRGK